MLAICLSVCTDLYIALQSIVRLVCTDLFCTVKHCKVSLHRPIYCTVKHYLVGLHRLVYCIIKHCMVGLSRLACTEWLPTRSFAKGCLTTHCVAHSPQMVIWRCTWTMCTLLMGHRWRFEDNFILTMTPIIHINPSQNLIYCQRHYKRHNRMSAADRYSRCIKRATSIESKPKDTWHG